MITHVRAPLDQESIEALKAGDSVLLSGTIFTARDAAHKRMFDNYLAGKELPFDLINQVIYYVGPTPPKENQVIGSAGPTTSERMDKYTPTLLDLGLKGMIGKGYRNEEVKSSIKKNKAIYFAAIGGSAALIAQCIKKVEVIAYEDLGTEAIRKLEVENMPLIVINDAIGQDYYELGVAMFKEI
jgi:fumarate hydratase subunit beta